MTVSRLKALDEQPEAPLGAKIIVVFGVIAGLAAAIALAGLLVLVGWNHGVVSLVESAGGSVSKINYGAALASLIVISVVKEVFSGRPRIGSEA